MNDIDTNDFKSNIQEWIRLKRTLAQAKDDIDVLKKREKELKEKVTVDMSSNKVDVVNLSKGEKISYKEGVRKLGVTKNVIEAGLLAAFRNNEAERERVNTCIQDCRKDKELKSVTVTGLNKKK